MIYPLLAIDGGGTKTIAVVTTENGEIVGTGKAGATNYQVVGREQAVHSLQIAIQKAIDSIQDHMKNGETISFERAVFALAGIDTNNDVHTVNSLVNEAVSSLSLTIKDMIIENDCLSALLGATQQSPGVLLISGTGSIVFAHDGKGHYVRAGGWGHRVGDEGSGYWIGKEAIRSVLKMYDGRESNTVLADLILQHFHFKSLEALYNWVYSTSYSVDDVSALTMVVEQAANQEDEISKRILDRAVYELEQLLYAVLQKVKIKDDSFTLVLQGGVLQHNHYIRHKILSGLQQTHPKLKLLNTDKEPIYNIIQRGLIKRNNHDNGMKSKKPEK